MFFSSDSNVSSLENRHLCSTDFIIEDGYDGLETAGTLALSLIKVRNKAVGRNGILIGNGGVDPSGILLRLFVSGIDMLQEIPVPSLQV